MSSSVPLFLQVAYLLITTAFNKQLIYKQRNLQAHTLYSLLCLIPLSHNLYPLGSLLSIFMPPPFLPHLHHLCQNITLTKNYTPFLFSLKSWCSWEKNDKIWERNNLKNKISLEMIWLISNQIHTASQRLPRLRFPLHTFVR